MQILKKVPVIRNYPKNIFFETLAQKWRNQIPFLPELLSPELEFPKKIKFQFFRNFNSPKKLKFGFFRNSNSQKVKVPVFPEL